MVDFMVNLQEVTLYESVVDRQGKSENKRNSTLGSSLTDELGNLVELVTVEPDLIQCLLMLGHMIRVWLELPQQALFFYRQAFDISMSSIRQKNVQSQKERQEDDDFANTFT